MDIRVLLEMVQVPEDTLKEVMGYVCSDLFSRILNYLNELDSDESDLAYTTYLKMLPKYKSRFGNFEIHSDYTDDHEISGEIGYNKKGIERRYYRNRKYPSKNIKLDFSVKLGKDNLASGTYTQKSRSKGILSIQLPSIDRIHAVALKPRFFEGFLEQIEGVARHELMHATQDLAIGLDFDEEDYYTDNNIDPEVDQIDFEKYYNDPLEFQPIIYAEYKKLLAMVKTIEAEDSPHDEEWRIPIDEMKAVFNHFIDPTAKVPYDEVFTSDAFKFWFNTNKQKWKKAVNIIYRLFQTDFKL